jgi:hypothetical protein
LIVIAFAVWYLIRYRRDRSFDYQVTVAAILGSLALLSVAYRLPGTWLAKDFYFEYFSVLRGVSNYAKGIPLLIGIAGAAMYRSVFHNLISKRLTLGKFNTNWGFLALVFSLSVLLLDNVPQAESFSTRTSLKPVINFWKQIPSNSESVTAHFPDFTYGKEWGLPSRFIQLSQIVLDHKIVNGRDYVHRAKRCASLPTPIDPKTFKTLLNRGVTRIILHRNLMIKTDLDAAISYLNTSGLVGKTYSSVQPTSPKEIMDPLDIIVFEIPENLSANQSC